MPLTIYKKLFELRILHDYYLTAQDGSSFFGIASSADREAFLGAKILSGQYDLRKDLKVRAFSATKALLNNHRMRLIATPTGFFVGLEVESLAGTSGLFPKIPFSEGFEMEFVLEILNPDLVSITNIPIGTAFPSRYLLSNANPSGDKVFPSLSLPISNFQANRVYDMGQMAIISADLKAANKRTSSSGGADWESVPGSGLANENDRLLLPRHFLYQFETTGVSTADFTLRNSAGDILKIITAPTGTDLKSFALDFRQSDSGDEIGSGQYELELNTNQYQYIRKVYLSDNHYQSSDLAFISIRQDSADGDFRLLENTGAIRQPHPVFEFRLRSRLVYSVFSSARGRSLDNIGNLTNTLVTDSGNQLVANAARPFSANPYRFASGVILPKPTARHLYKENGSYYSKVYVEEVDSLITYTP